MIVIIMIIMLTIVLIITKHANNNNNSMKHRSDFGEALREINAGRKQGCWSRRLSGSDDKVQTYMI